MKILIIGGRGNISWWCVKKLSEKNEVITLNREETILSRRPSIMGVKNMIADIQNKKAVLQCLGDETFDCIIDFVCYNMEDAKRDVELFQNRTKQFVYISSTAIYERKGYCTPITEERPLKSGVWEYSNGKLEGEKYLMEAFQKTGFPVTIVRPGHTYDTLVPEAVGNADFTVCQRILDGNPIIVHGDGNVYWSLLHSADFAAAFCGLVGNENCIGEAYHIAGEEPLTWNDITEIISKRLGIKKPNVVYISSQTIYKMDAQLGAGIIEHKQWCDVYDNSKLKSVVGKWKPIISAEEGIKRTIDWIRSDKNHMRINMLLDNKLDNIIQKYV